MKKCLILSLSLILLAPSLAFSDIFTFKGGYLQLQMKSDLWDTEFENMDFRKKDYYDTSFGLGYEYFINRQVSFVLSVEWYDKAKTGIYNNFVGETIEGDNYAFDYGAGFEIEHVFSVSIVPIQASLKLMPYRRAGTIIPYIGGGIGLYLWNVRIQGEMVNFNESESFYDPGRDEDVEGYTIYPADAEENRISVGFHAFAGIMVPLVRRVTLDIEAKYNYAEGTLKDSFQGFEPFDLSGFQVTAGLSLWF
jgi:opacity protein-like surface antigen